MGLQGGTINLNPGDDGFTLRPFCGLGWGSQSPHRELQAAAALQQEGSRGRGGLCLVHPDFPWRGPEWAAWARSEGGSLVAWPLFQELPDPFSCQILGRRGFLPPGGDQGALWGFGCPGTSC